MPSDAESHDEETTPETSPQSSPPQMSEPDSDATARASENASVQPRRRWQQGHAPWVAVGAVAAALLLGGGFAGGYAVGHHDGRPDHGWPGGPMPAAHIDGPGEGLSPNPDEPGPVRPQGPRG